MGYTTDFQGEFTLDAPLTPAQQAYLIAFSLTRRVQRDEGLLGKHAPDGKPCFPDPIRSAVGLPPGPEGAYFVGGGGYMGQDRDVSVLDYSRPPSGQPGLWCQWVPNDAATAIVWDEGEKFYYYVEWLQYLIAHFLAPWGRVLNGEVKWRGEQFDDVGTIVVRDNVVTTEDW